MSPAVAITPVTVTDAKNVRSVYRCVCKYSHRVFVFLVYHGLHLSLIYQTDLTVFFSVVQTLLQPLDVIETLIYIVAI